MLIYWCDVFIDQTKHLRVWIFECKGRSHDAFVLGVAAAVLLGVAHLLANLLGFLGAPSQNESHKPPPSKKFSKIIFVCTWYPLSFCLIHHLSIYVFV